MVHHTNWLRASFFGPLVKRLRQRPLTPLTWVRFPHGSPKYSSLAQSVEHAAVNRRVVGSSPTGGAKNEEPPLSYLAAVLFYGPLAQLVRATGS